MELQSFSCEIRIIQAQNVGITKNLFARLYLPAGNNRSSIQLNSKMVSSKSNPFWNESFSLDCSCPEEFLETLQKESLVLELRQSSAATKVLRRIFGGSRLVGRGEIPWKAILESQNMEFKEWVKIDSCDGDSSTTFSVPEVQVEIKIKVVASEKKDNSSKRLNKWDECGCKQGHDHHAWCSAEDYHVFSFGAALEAF